jgi:N-acetylated-alpha-linked acidic dipeptidase
MSSEWYGGGLYYKGVDYHVGPSPSHIVLNLDNQMSFPNKDVYQVFGTIKGKIEDEVIILGNHRDSWGPGAGDSISGAAALMEVARSFGTAYKRGWRPRRSIMFVSWEGAEVGQVGSQPWIAEHLPWLQKTAVAYLNVVVAAGGTDFQVKATPLLRDVIHQATKAVASPEGSTVFDHWSGDLIAAGGGDAIPFLETACVSTVDFSFGAVYWAYHSNFDTFAWMNSSGDPGWKYHVASAKIWSLIAAYLSETPILQMEAAEYAVAMRKYVKRIKDSIPGAASFDLGPLEDAIEEYHNASIILDAYASSLKSTESSEAIQQVNQKYLNLERQFCYKNAHLIYEFSAFYTDPPEFPRLYWSLDAGDLEKAQVSISHKPPCPKLMLTTLRAGWTSFKAESRMLLIL